MFWFAYWSIYNIKQRCLEKSTSINNHDSFPSNCIYSERLEVTLLSCKNTT